MFKNIPFDRVNWVTSSFLFGTFILCLTAVPAYLWVYGMSPWLLALFLFYTIATGLSITLGYHRLFSHLSFQAKWPVRLFVTLFGAAAFENSVISWASDHRRHHKHCDHEDDPYDISRGFWWAHIGWLIFKLNPEPPVDNVNDLRKDPLVAWQDKWCHLIAVTVGFILPAALGFAFAGWSGALGGFLVAGVLRVVCVQHATFFINSACHYFGRQPYSSRHSARDSWVMALFTFGEGYHNFHHEFQHDYRNGVKPWQFDPTKWMIWLLSKLGLVRGLRRVPSERILLAELAEARNTVDRGLKDYQERLSGAAKAQFDHTLAFLQAASDDLGKRYHDLQAAVRERVEISHDNIEQWRRELRLVMRQLQALQSAS